MRDFKCRTTFFYENWVLVHSFMMCDAVINKILIYELLPTRKIIYNYFFIVAIKWSKVSSGWMR